MSEHLDAIEGNAEAVKRWMDTDVSNRRNLSGLIRALDYQRGDVAYLLNLARKQQAALDAVRELADYWERTPALRRGTSGAAIREVLEGE